MTQEEINAYNKGIEDALSKLKAKVSLSGIRVYITTMADIYDRIKELKK